MGGVMCISEIIDISPSNLDCSCASSSLTFSMMYSAYKLNNQDDIIQPWHTPSLIWNRSVVSCPVLAVASWSAQRFLRRQVRCSGISIAWLISTVCYDPHKGFGIVNKAEVDAFSGTLLLFLMIQQILQFDVWFLCLFKMKLEYLEVLSSQTVEA